MRTGDARSAGVLDMRVTIFLFRPPALEQAATSGRARGDALLRIGGIKLGVDGGFEGGWMREPYAEP